jgi:CheY-like chemotaxis protein
MGNKILVVDDDKLILGTLKRLLRKEGFDVEIAQNGLEALERIKNSDFNLIITDIRMPGIDGIETLKQIRVYLSESGKTPVPEVVITGFDNHQNRDRAGELNVAGFLTKPFDLKDLLGNIEANIKRKD